MNRKHFISIAVLLASAALVVVALVIDVGKKRPAPTEEPVAVRKPDFMDPIGEAKPGYVLVGGVYRPESDVKPIKRSPSLKPSMPPDFGENPKVPVNTNANTRSVAEAHKTGKYPERLSPMIAPKAFDKAAYESDPQQYLAIVEPGRVWQTAQPGPNVPRLKGASSRFRQITQGESATLAVRAVPNAPVTFTSFDLGSFENRLTTITVQADETGLAQAQFTGTPGTIADVDILAASPVTSGQARFVVNVQMPRNSGAGQTGNRNSPAG